jgi:hypothetical protein
MLKKLLHPSREEGAFTNVRHQTSRHRRTVVLLLLSATAVIGWLYVFFGSDIFHVSRMDIEGLVSLNRGQVEREVQAAFDERGMGPWKQVNLLFIDEQDLAAYLEKRLYAERVIVEKSYPNILRLKVIERASSLVVIANNEFYLIDHMGMGLKRISTEEEAAILQRVDSPSRDTSQASPVLHIEHDVSFAPGETFIGADTARLWLGAFRDLSEAGFGYRNAVLEHPTSTKLILNLFEPYAVYLDLLAAVRPQIESYYAFSKSKTSSMKIREYVDVRVPGRVYYK